MEQPQATPYIVLKSQVTAMTGSRVIYQKEIWCKNSRPPIVKWCFQCLFFFSGLKLESNGRKNSCHILIGTSRYITKKIRSFMTIFFILILWNETLPENCHEVKSIFLHFGCFLLQNTYWKSVSRVESQLLLV